MKKVLMVSTQEFIQNRKDGGKLCAYRNYEMLKSVYSPQNIFLYIFGNEENQNDDHIVCKKTNKKVLYRVKNSIFCTPFFSNRQETELIEFILQNKIDIVFFQRSFYGKLVKRLKRLGIESQIFMENIEKNYFQNKMKRQNFLYIFPYVVTSLLERKALHYADSIICLTSRDADSVEEIYNRKCTAIIPMTFSDSYQNIDVQIDRNEKKLMFIGSLFPPNLDGIKWFVDNVMSSLDNFKLYIVGKNFEEKRYELERENVVIIGTVDDLIPYYSQNCALVMPILFGDGIKVKTAEAMMFGKVIFATENALIGYDVQDVKGIYQCDTAEEFINNINEFYQDEWIAFSNDVRKCFLENYENSRAIERYKKMISTKEEKRIRGSK